MSKFFNLGRFVVDKAVKALPRSKKVSPTIKSVKPTKLSVKESLKKTRGDEYSKRIKKFLHYFFPPLFLKICVPFIPKIDAHTSIHKLVNHVGSSWKCSKMFIIFSIAAGSSDQTPQASTKIGNVNIARTTSSL